MRTEKQLIRVLQKLRAQAAREYSNTERNRVIYRDGYTDGWYARGNTEADEHGPLCKAQRK